MFLEHLLQFGEEVGFSRAVWQLDGDFPLFGVGLRYPSVSHAVDRSGECRDARSWPCTLVSTAFRIEQLDTRHGPTVSPDPLAFLVAIHPSIPTRPDHSQMIASKEGFGRSDVSLETLLWCFRVAWLGCELDQTWIPCRVVLKGIFNSTGRHFPIYQITGIDLVYVRRNVYGERCLERRTSAQGSLQCGTIQSLIHV